MTEYKPDYVTPPGDTLREVLAEYGMTPREFAERLRRPASEVRGVLSGRIPIVQSMAMALQAETGIPMTFWLAREAAYRASLEKGEGE